MKIEKQVCSAQQAEKLKELGINGPSLHEWWKMKYPANEENIAKNRANCLITPTEDANDSFIMHFIDNENAHFHWHEGTHKHGWDHSRCELEGDPFPAYTVAELGIMLPDYLMRSDIDADMESGHGIGIWNTGTNWGMRLERKAGTTTWFSTEAEARAQLLIQCLESKLITPEEVNSRLQND